MQERPDAPQLLEALAQFLVAELQPTVADKKLAFRVLIAANLASTVAAELRTQEPRALSELQRLRALLPDVVAQDPAKLPEKDRRDALRALNSELVLALKQGRFEEAELAKVRAHLEQTLKDALAVQNPRFDVSEEIE